MTVNAQHIAILAVHDTLQRHQLYSAILSSCSTCGIIVEKGLWFTPNGWDVNKTNLISYKKLCRLCIYPVSTWLCVWPVPVVPCSAALVTALVECASTSNDCARRSASCRNASKNVDEFRKQGLNFNIYICEALLNITGHTQTLLWLFI